MVEGSIGLGTWYDKIALQIAERERQLHRDLSVLRTESGIGASGLPHIGSVSDATRSHTVTLAIENLGFPSELIAFSDDKDGLRSVPQGFPESLWKYLGYPVTSIPDPFGACHESYGEHMSALLLDALDRCGVEYRFMSGTDAYKRGLLNEQIEKLLGNSRRVGEIVKEEVGQDKYEETLPYFPVCANCGRIYTSRAYQFESKTSKVLYKCQGMEVKGQWLEGCGHKDEVDFRRGEGKLSWKAGEFAARWAALGISFEAYGKDIAESVKVNDRICREVLRYEPPLHVQYELFLDATGRKVSKSSGNALTPQLWFRYGSSQSLVLLTLKRFTGTRTISVSDIPRYMDELNTLEDVFFGKRRASNVKERTKVQGLYRYCWVLKPPDEPRLHIPYNLMVYLTKLAPMTSVSDFVYSKLKSYRYLGDDVSRHPDVEELLQYATNWIEDFEDVDVHPVQLTQTEATAIADLAVTFDSLSRIEGEEGAIQAAVFETARTHHLNVKHFFRLLYMILLGVPSGPKLGDYIKVLGVKRAAERLREATSGSGTAENP
jgi:lysyl-tRNA synthetase class 1